MKAENLHKTVSRIGKLLDEVAEVVAVYDGSVHYALGAAETHLSAARLHVASLELAAVRLLEEPTPKTTATAPTAPVAYEYEP